MATDNNSQKKLEELIHRELSKLPERTAPESLIPQVFAQIRAREQKRWWQRPWTQWPFAIQLASLPMMFAGAGGAIFALILTWKALLGGSEFDIAPRMVVSASAAWDVLAALGNAVLVLSRAAGQEYLWLALFVPLAMYLACVGLGTLCYRVAFHNR